MDGALSSGLSRSVRRGGLVLGFQFHGDIMYPASANDNPEHDLWMDTNLLKAGEERQSLLRYFGFHEAPFGVTPNPDFLFSSGMHRAALQSMVQSIESNLGFTVLLGEPGLGKTTLLHHLLAQYRDSARTAFIFQTQCKRYDLLRYLASELELPVRKGDEVSLHQHLKEMLVNEARAGRKVLIIIDEAQNLQPSSLEAIRLLSDFETARVKLMHIILAGSSQLGETLLSPELSQLAQRISTVCRLSPLSFEEVRAYIAHRLGVAGCRDAEYLFTADSIAEVIEKSEGIPRIVNSLCNHSLLLAYTARERRVTARLMRQAAQDLALVHSSDRGSLSPAHPLPTPQKRQAFTETEFPEENRGMFDSQRPDPTSTQEHLPAIEPSSANEVEQSTSSSPFPQQRQTSQTADRSQGYLEQAHGTKIPLSPHASTFRLFRSKAVIGTRNGDRSSLIIGMLVLLALGLLAGWYGLNDSLGVARVGGSSQTTADTAYKSKYPGSSLFNVDQVNVDQASPLPTGQSNTNAEDHKLRVANARPVETLPQTALSSKLRLPDASPAEVTTSPSTTELSKALRDPVPSLTAASGSGPAPRLDERNANPVDASPVNASPVNANPVIDTSQDSILRPLKTVNPEYPKVAKLRQVEGEVLLRLQVGPDGNVKQVSTLSGNVLLREAAERAAWQWQYPANQLSSSRPILVRIIFKLNSESVK